MAGKRRVYVTAQQERVFLTRWRDIQKRSANLDFDAASLARDIRKCFPSGPSGLDQWRKWVSAKLGVSRHTVGKLERSLTGIKVFPNASTWDELGGYHGACLLAEFPGPARRRILSKKRKKYGLAPVGASTIRNIGYSLGLRPARPGRPTQTESEGKLEVLRSFVERLYEEYSNLPAIPADVKYALGKTPLQLLADTVAA